jgi:hypothetical protein
MGKANNCKSHRVVNNSGATNIYLDCGCTGHCNKCHTKVDIGKPMEPSNASPVVAVRLPFSVIERVNQHMSRLRKQTGLEPSRSEVVKLLVEIGLRTVEGTNDT